MILFEMRSSSQELFFRSGYHCKSHQRRLDNDGGLSLPVPSTSNILEASKSFLKLCDKAFAPLRAYQNLLLTSDAPDFPPRCYVPFW